MRNKTSSFPGIAVALLGICILIAGCCRRIKVPDGPTAKVKLTCSQAVTDILDPSEACITIAASTKNKCDITVSISCGETEGPLQIIKPGKQATLCCPEGKLISKINIKCQNGSGECSYYIVGHAQGAPTHKRCFK